MGIKIGSFTWVQQPGAATDIEVGSNGTVWVLGTNPVPGGFGIFRWNGSDWEGIDGEESGSRSIPRVRRGS